MNPIRDRTGEIKIMNCGEKATIIKYNNANNITVEFKEYNEVINNCRYTQFKSGNIKSKYAKSIYGVGYIGIGEYNPCDEKGNKEISYICWHSMIKRCYDEKEQLKPKSMSYKDCEVCEEWHCFQTFAKWFDENYYECKEELTLDKDILCKRNKVYSPENCIFVPERINLLFTKCDKSRGDYPIGITYHNNNFRARCNTLNTRVSLGLYNTPEDAFYKGYKPFKEAYIKEIAEEYKSKIPFILYEAMYRYIVEIDD